MSSQEQNKIPIGAHVRITVPQDESLPGGWAGMKSMVDIGVLLEYSNRGKSVYISFPKFTGKFYTETWCIEEVVMDNESLIQALPLFPMELRGVEHLFQIGN